MATCKADGTVETSDCRAQQKRCVNGVCVAALCEAGKQHCYNGNLYTCNATGSARTLVKDCATGSEVCQEDVSPPACRRTCKLPRGINYLVLSKGDCECNWDDVDFCEVRSAPVGCTTTLCISGQVGVGASKIPCERETVGLVVPGSERRDACAGAGNIGTMTVAYQVCIGGKPVPASRTVPCQR